MAGNDDIDSRARPSGPAASSARRSGGWWFHLRRCARCGHVGCCDSSPSQHAAGHARTAGHPIVRASNPDERLVLELRPGRDFVGRERLAPPSHHPLDQPVPGPAGRVPAHWERLLH